jgi:hypothetical protein
MRNIGGPIENRMTFPGRTPPCELCKHMHHADVAFTCTNFLCECDAKPVAADSTGLSAEARPWRGLHRGDRAIIETKATGRYVPIAFRPLIGQEVIVGSYSPYREGVCSTKHGQPHYHVVLETDMRYAGRVAIEKMPFLCVPTAMLRAVKMGEFSPPMPQPQQREPDLVIRGPRGE